MTLFHKYDVLTSSRGDGLPGFQVVARLPNGGAVQPIFSDTSGTPIVSASGIANTAITDNAGNFSFYVAPGTYDLEYSTAAGVFVSATRNVPMLNGPQGPQGDDGASAYQVWLDQGNTGSEDDYLTSLKSFSSVAGSEFSGKAFARAGSAATAPLSQRFAHTINAQDDCGAVGENVTINTAALTAAINQAQASAPARGNMPVGIYVPPGLYKFDAPLPAITTPVVLFSDSPRAAQLVPVGNFSGTTDLGSGRIVNNAALTFLGSGGARCANAGLRNIGINAAGMTGGFAISADWVQDFNLANVLLANAWNGLSLRQAGSTVIRSTRIEGVRGPQGMLAYAANAARNGENDQIDVIIFDDVVMGGTYVAGGASNATTLLTLDGRVHTTDLRGLRLINAGRGLLTQNSPGLPGNFVPRFLTGYALEAENMFSECFSFQALLESWIGNLFAVGSNTSDGIKLSSAVYDLTIANGTVNSNYGHGVNTNGAGYTELSGVTAYNNSLNGVGTKSGVYVSGSGRVVIRGGSFGRNPGLPAYTEPQKYGVELDSAFNGVLQLDGPDLRNNYTGPAYDNGGTMQGSYMRSCPGYNPLGASAVTPGASPWARTAGLSDEQLFLSASSSVLIDGQTIAVPAGVPIPIPARRTAQITYSGSPTATVVRS